MFSLNVTINESFYRKLNADNIRKAENETIKLITYDAEEACRREAPVRTGNLRDSHYTEFFEDIGRVMNSADYAPHVIYGTENRSPNNYPQRALNSIQSSYKSRFYQSLADNGVL